MKITKKQLDEYIKKKVLKEYSDKQLPLIQKLLESLRKAQDELASAASLATTLSGKEEDYRTYANMAEAFLMQFKKKIQIKTNQKI